MTATVIEPRTTGRDGDGRDDLIHVICDCTGVDVAMCGVSLIGATFLPGWTDDDVCAACLVLSEIPHGCDEVA